MYLTFHYRPPHEKDPGGLRHEREQNAAGVGSSHEEGTSATASASASGSSPQGEAPGSNHGLRPAVEDDAAVHELDYQGLRPSVEGLCVPWEP